MVRLVGRARHVVIGTSADPSSRADGERIAETWGGPVPAAAWRGQARRCAAPEPDVWVVCASPAGWAGMARRLAASTSWSPHRTVLTATLEEGSLPGLRGARADGSSWEN